MKIQALPTHPDADCNFFAAGGKRIAYLDTTPTHHSNNTPMYKVTVHPPGTVFPPNGYPVFTLYYRNDDGGPGNGRDSRIIFDPPADGRVQGSGQPTRCGMGGVNFGYQPDECGRRTLTAIHAQGDAADPDHCPRATPIPDHVHRRAHRRLRWADHRAHEEICPAGLHLPDDDDRSGHLHDDGRPLCRRQTYSR